MDYKVDNFPQKTQPEREPFAPQPESELPLPSEQEHHKLNKVGAEAISNVNRNQEIVSPENFEDEPTIDIVEIDPLSNSPQPNLSENTDDFSRSQEFKKADDEIIRQEITLLEKHPYDGTERVHQDKEKYLNQKFGRIFGAKAA